MQFFKKTRQNLNSANTPSDVKLLEQLGALVVELDEENNVLAVNTNACNVLGYSEDEIIGENWFKKFALNPDGGQNKVQNSYEKVILTKTGEERLISWRKIEIRNKKGNFTSLICVGKDITAHNNFLLTLHQIAATLLTGDESVPYEKFIKLVAEAANANHTYIFVNKYTEEEGVRIQKICEWGGGQFIYNEEDVVDLQDLSLAIFKEELVTKLVSGQVLNMRTSSFTKKDQEFFMRFDIRAILIIPIIVDGSFFGFIGFDNRVNDREWSNSEIEFLKASVKNLEQKIHSSNVDRALKNENARFQTTMDAVEVIILVSRFENNKIIYGNSFAVDKLGDILDKSPAEALELSSPFLESDYSKLNLIEDGIPLQAKLCEVYSESQNRYYSCQIKAIKWTNGEWVRLETITDVTEKKQGENQLLNSEAKFRKLSAISVEGIIIHDQGVIVEANQAFLDLMEYPYDEVIGQNIIELAAHPSSHSLIYKMMRIGSPKPYEILGISKHGKAKPLELFARSVNYEGEEVRVVAVRDITERKEAEQELIRQKNIAEESNRLKTQFLNNLSHEIRTPLNGIVGFSQFLTDPGLSEENLKNFVSIIQNSSHQLVRIIDDIIEISKLETKQVKPLIGEVNLNSLLLEMFSIFELKAVDKGVSLHLNRGLTDAQSVIYTDKTKLLKILNNLVENALKFTHVGEVEIGCELESEQLNIWVKDSGIGIELEKQSLIFDRFSQAEKDPSKDYGGLGLGLSIAKENVELLGGEISVQSSLGKGAIFMCSLPYNPVNKMEEQEKQEVESGTQSAFKILIAEDEEVNFIFLEFLLLNMKSKVEVIHARNGREAIEYFEKGGVCDMVFMDLKMPEVDGITATRKIKMFFPEMSIVAITAFSSAEDRKNAIEAGCSDFITKPISVEGFKNMCSKFLKDLEV